jgi:hypothetical protein
MEIGDGDQFHILFLSLLIKPNWRKWTKSVHMEEKGLNKTKSSPSISSDRVKNKEGN